MPLYHCLTPRGALEPDTRAALAEALTDVHTTVTGAPRVFVNVVFTEYDPTAMFTAGRPGSTHVINASVRAGRDRETRARLLADVSAAWTRIAGVASDQVLIGLTELDPTSTMEAGLIMPGPGEEAAWFAEHGDVLGH